MYVHSRCKLSPLMKVNAVSRDELVRDADQWALSFCRDFRALHQFNHDHDCQSTCIKYVAKKGLDAAKKALKTGKAVVCRFFFYHIVEFTYKVLGAAKTTTRRIRRRGKILVRKPYIARTNEHGEFCKVIVRRDTPFRSASTLQHGLSVHAAGLGP